MRKALLGFILMVTYYASISQTTDVVEINDALTAHRYEFSSLAKWQNKIVLIPQNRKNVIDSVYFIDSTEIESSLRNNTATKHTAFYIDNLLHTGPLKDSVFINKKILLNHYDGIEATVIKNDTIFFSLETTADYGYIIKGVINQHAKTIHILEDTLHIPNTYAIDNAGFESLAWLPHKNSLLAFFECNKDTVNAKIFLFSASLKSRPQPLAWAQPLYFRLTDVYALNDSELIGINRLFTAPVYTKERDAYLKDVDSTLVNRQFTNGGNVNNCFTQIIKLIIRKNKIYWQPLKFISLNIVDNYEGIVPFKNGALMVVDGEPGNVFCRLVYVPLKL